MRCPFCCLILLITIHEFALDTNERFCEKDSNCNYEVIKNRYSASSSWNEVFTEDEIPKVVWWYNDGVYPHFEEKHIQCKIGSCIVSNQRYSNGEMRGVIMYGTSFDANNLPLPRLPHHQWALIHEESPKNNWMFTTDLGMSLFNHTATFSRGSDYPLTTQHLRDVNEWIDAKYYLPVEEKNRLQKSLGLGIAVYFQRDCDPPSDRDTYIRELMKYIRVDSYGPCVNNRKPPENISGFHCLSSNAFYKFLAQYKFHIAFENALCSDYMTEKLFRPLRVNAVPVYLGSSHVRDFMPSEKSVIMVEDFESPRHLAEYLNMLNTDDAKYNEYLSHFTKKKFTNPKLLSSIKNAQRWRSDDPVNFGHYMFAGFSCHVCDKIHERNNQLRKHYKEPQKFPRPQRRIADSSHMKCSVPTRIFKQERGDEGKITVGERIYRYANVMEFARIEAEAILKMLNQNETDSQNFSKKYLKIKTYNYP